MPVELEGAHRWRAAPLGTATKTQLSHIRNRDTALHPRAPPEAIALVHAVAHVKDELRGCSSDARAMRYAIERLAQFRMLGDVTLDVVQALPRGLQGLFKFH